MFLREALSLLPPLALAGTVAFAVGGCQSSQQTKSETAATAEGGDQRLQYMRFKSDEARPAPTPTAAPTGWPCARDPNLAWSRMAFPTGDAATSAVGIEKGVPKEVRMGVPFEYQMVVTNLTAIRLDDVIVSETLGPNLKVNSSNPPAQSGSGGTMTWAIGALNPGCAESKIIRVTAVATAEGTVSSCAAVSYRSVICAVIPVVSPKLKLTKTGPAEVLKCEEIVYNFEVSNPGTGAVSGVKVSDSLPAGLSTTDGKKAVEFAVGTLAAGQSRQLSARVMAEKGGKYDNKATATADGGMSVESGVVSTVVRQPVLAITTKCPPKQYIGRSMEFSLTVSNNGDGVARDTVAEVAVPPGTQFNAASDGGKVVGGKVVWSVGKLDPKASKTVTVEVTPNAPGTFGLDASARGYRAAPVTAACKSEVTGIPAILLEVVDVSDPVKVGENETYVITVTNQGSAPDTNIKLTCTLEANQQYVSSTGPTQAQASGSTITFAPVPTIGPKEKITFRVEVKNVKAGDVRFKATMKSDQLTRDVEETEATNVYEH